MEQPLSISGQILALYERGYSQDEILLEMRARPGHKNITAARVNAIIKQMTGRSADSRRISEIYELCLETLTLVREVASDAQKRRIEQQARLIEKRKLTGP